MNMSPWWKRPTSESASAAAQKQSEQKGRKPSRPKQSDNDDSDNEPRRRRRGRRGGGRGNRSGNRNPNRNSGGGSPSKGGSRRPKRSSGRRKPTTGGGLPVLLVEVEALHKHLKIDGDGPSDTAKLFAQVGAGVRRRAVACGMRKQKVQRALKELDFEIEQVDGGVEDARLRLALDALELALDHKGAQIFLLTQVGGIDVLGDRLRHHGAAVTTFSLSEPPVIGDAPAASDDEDDEDDDDCEAADEDLDDDDADEDGDDDDEAPRGRQRGRRRRRRRGGRRTHDTDDADDSDDTDDGDEDDDEPVSQRSKKRTESESDPFELLRAAVGKLAEGEGEVVWATKVRQRMFELDPVFNELDHGYRDFDALLREAERRGHVSLQKDPRTSTFIVVAWRAA